MFGSIDKSRGILFCTYDLAGTLSNATAEMQREIDSINADRLLNTAPHDLAKYFADKFQMEPLKINKEGWYAEDKEVKIDVRHDQMRWIEDKSRPCLVPGVRIEVRVPFEGNSELLYSSPNTMTSNPPKAIVQSNELVLRYESPIDAPRDVRPLIDSTLTEIERYLGWQAKMIDAYNSTLLKTAEQTIEQRRNRLLAQSQRVAALGIPIRRREDAPKTYAIPTVRKIAKPQLPPASSAPFIPEPTWAMEQYEQALKIMQDMTLVMERSPEAFKTMNEESIRQAFLMQLNGQFEGKATGETFNMSGKTDILLREGEKNVFIAECKFWKGPKAFSEAIDQLLGYATWRDTKTAILVFNRGTDTSTVINGVNTMSTKHSNFKRTIDWPHESGFRYMFHANGDVNRELILTVLVFHVPG
jgi:hypothetical protein